MQLKQECALNKEVEEVEKESQRVLTTNMLRNVLGNMEDAMKLLKELDPARSGTTEHRFDKLMKMDKEMFETKKRLAKQTTISSFKEPAPC